MLSSGLTRESRQPLFPEILRFAQNDNMRVLDSLPQADGNDYYGKSE
jgi:hypothetical protein